MTATTEPTELELVRLLNDDVTLTEAEARAFLGLPVPADREDADER